MTYPSSSPWGPHGPQVPAHSVTPNPTPPSSPYVPGASAPAPVDYGAGRGGGASVVAAGPAPWPLRKSVVAAVLLSLFMGPASVFYATYGARQFLSGMIYTGIAIVLLVMRPVLWIPVVVISLIWSVRAVKTFNLELARQKAAAANRSQP